MKDFSICVLIVSIAAFAGAAKPHLPKGVKLCRRGDDGCLLNGIQSSLPVFKSGSSKLGMFPIDPLRVSELMIDQGSGPVAIRLTFRNQDIIGISDARITGVKGQFTDKTYHLELTAEVPRIQLIGDYVIAGKVLVLPIQGEGHDNLTLTDFLAKISMDGHIVERNGEEYVEIDDFKLRFSTKRLYMDFENLFNGDKALGDNMITFLNENWSDILSELQPPIEEAFSEILKTVTARVYAKVPYKQIHLI